MVPVDHVNSRWAKALNCPVYISAEDQEWLMRKDLAIQNCWTGSKQPILPRVTVVKVGGHFPGISSHLWLTPGSAVLHWDRSRDNLPSVILTADSIMPLLNGMVSVMWSYPNFIGLGPDDMLSVWKKIKDVDFDWIYGGWYFVPVIKNGKPAILKSLQQITEIMTKSKSHPIFTETI